MNTSAPAGAWQWYSEKPIPEHMWPEYMTVPSTWWSRSGNPYQHWILGEWEPGPIATVECDTVYLENQGTAWNITCQSQPTKRVMCKPGPQGLRAYAKHLRRVHSLTVPTEALATAEFLVAMDPDSVERCMREMREQAVSWNWQGLSGSYAGA